MTTEETSPMTPIRQIVVYGIGVFTEDYAGLNRLAARGATPEDAKWLGWSLGKAHGVPCNEVRLDIQATPDSVIDASTARMMLETGHECEVDDVRTRDLLATVHNFIGSYRAWKMGDEDSERMARKFSEMALSHDKLQEVSDAHFSRYEEWKRP